MREAALIEFLNENHWTIGSVESFTGGLFAKTLTDVPGASKVFKGTLVTYANETKVRLLSIPQETLTKHGAVSKEIATLMALNGKKALNVDICVSFTGNAGPDILDQLPVGTCFIGIATAQTQKNPSGRCRTGGSMSSRWIQGLAAVEPGSAVVSGASGVSRGGGQRGGQRAHPLGQRSRIRNSGRSQKWPLSSDCTKVSNTALWRFLMSA